MRKITSLLTLLLLCVVGAQAQSWTIDVSASTGTFYRYGSANTSGWAESFTSTGTPVVTISNASAARKFPATRDGIATEPGSTVDWTISVEDGYVITAWTIEGYMNNGTCIITPTDGTAVTFTTSSTTINVEGLATQSTGFSMTDPTTGDKRLNFTKFQIKVAKAYELTVSQTTGAFTSSNATGTWGKVWESTETDPKVTVTAGANNMGTTSVTSPAIDFRSGTAESSTYTVSCSDGYIIVAGSFTGAALSSDQTVTVEGNTKVFTTTQETFNFPVDSHAQSFGFVLSGANSGLGGTMKVVMIKPSTTPVTYNLYYDGSLIGSETVNADLGYAPELPSSLQTAAFMDYDYDVTEITSATTEVNVTATWNGPFTFSEDYDNAVWYFMTLKSSYNVAYVEGATNNVQLPSSRDSSEKYQWAFVGGPYTGVTIYNRAAGAGLVFGSATHDTSIDTGASTHVNMKAPGTQDEEVWHLVASSYTTDGFYLLNSHNQALNQRSTTSLDYWTGGMDLGSTFNVTAVPNDPYYDDILTLVTPYLEAANAGHAGEYFQLASSGNDVINFGAAYTQVETNHASNVVSTLDDYNNIVTLLGKAIVYPETGYYRIKSSGSRYGTTYMAYNNGLATIYEANASSDPSTVLKLTKTGDNVYTISSQGLNLQTRNANNTQYSLTSAEGAPFEFIINQPGVVAIHDINNTEATNNCLHESNWGVPAAILRWSATSNASQWTVEDADVVTLTLNEIDGKSYGTTYLPFDAYFLSGVKPYAVEVNGNYATYTEITDADGFKAGTGVLLISETGATQVTAYVNKYMDSPAVADNDLTGHYLASTVDEGALVLNKNSEDVVGFYTLSSSSTLAANRAYLPASLLGGGVRSLVLTGATTGIAVAGSEFNGTEAYDLQGRRAAKAERGLYIVGGKKVLVK